MEVYKTKWFDRWARKEGLNDFSLCDAVSEMTAGLYDANLGGGLLKKRIARRGREREEDFVHW